MRWFSFALLAAAAIAGAASLDAGEATVPFTLTSSNNIVVRAVLNHTDALVLMLHTAASDVSLTEDAVKRARSLKFDGRASTQSWGGSSDARVAMKNTLEIGPLTRAVVVHEDKNSGPETDGKFGLDFFDGGIVEIDYDRNRIALHDRLPAKAARYARAKVENDNGALFVTAICMIAGKAYTTKFLLHSGYSGGILLDDAFAAASGIDGKVAITKETILKDSFDNAITVKSGVLPTFAIGGLTVTDVPVGFFAGNLGQQKISVIGGAVLKRFNLIFDKAHGALYLQART